MKKLIVFFGLLLISCFIFMGCNKDNNPDDGKKEDEAKSYVVTFVNMDDSEIEKQTIESGKSATAPTPKEIEGYTFKGWDKDFSNVTSDLTVKALYEKNKYSVKLLVDGEVFVEVEVLYGELATLPSIAPEKEGYDFDGWDNDKITEPIKSNLEANALFTIKQVTVSFYLEDKLLEEIKVNYGADCTTSLTPLKEGYKFTGWDKDLTGLKEDISVHAVFEKAVYTITYYDGSTKLNLEPSTYTIDDLVFLPEYEKDGYEFVGWNDSPTSNVKIASLNFGETGDKVFYARFTKIEEEKKLEAPEGATFVFNNIKKVLHSSGTFYVYQPDFTQITGTAPSTSVTKYTWESLDTSVATISQWSSISVASSGYCIIKCTYTDNNSIFGYAVIHTTPDGVFAATIEEANNKPKYTVKFVDADDTLLSEEVVELGQTATPPTIPTHEGKTFIGWDKPIYSISEDLTIKAQYIDGTSHFANKKVSILGDSITTFKGYVPDGYACFYPYPTADVRDVNQTWWMGLVNNLGMKLLKNNSWSGSCVSSGTGTSACVNDSRLIELIDGETLPDIIIIYMGSNDCASKYVELSTFKSSYKIMLDKIKALCPDAEIYLCTLSPSGLCAGENRINYNKVILDYAEEYNLPVIDFNKIWTDSTYTDYVVDSGHPNKAGMEKYTRQAMIDMLQSDGVTYNG